MYVIVKDKDEIEKCQCRFIDILTAGAYPLLCKLGFPKPSKSKAVSFFSQIQGTTLSADTGAVP